MEPTHRFLRACLGLPVDRTPFWMMRQAGRYLPQYRRVRSQTTFLGLCKSPDLACEVTLQPIDEFGMDAAILFSDILIPLEAMGMRLEFTEDGPKLPQPIRDHAAIERLVHPDPQATMPFVLDAVRQIKTALGGRVPLIGFSGAPLTLAAYAVEGGGSSQWIELKRLLYGDPEAAQRLLGKIGEMVTTYLLAQIQAGAEAVQIFDTWAGILADRDFEAFAGQHVRAIVKAVHAAAPGVPVIYYVNGGSPYLEQMQRTGADVIGLDWRIDLGAARARLGATPVQGNLDPAVLFAPPAVIEERVRQIVAAGQQAPGHIFNLGHGVLPPTPVENVRAMVEAVRRHGESAAGPR